MKAVYLVKRIFGMDYKKLFETVGAVHEKSGKNRVYLFYDIVRCGFKYSAGYSAYI